MQIAILLYDRFTALDADRALRGAEPAERRRGGLRRRAARPGATDTGMLAITADAALADVAHPDIVLVPGGPGQEAQMDDGPMHEWLRQADAATSWTTSVCTGSLILAAAGLLAGRRATSHWLALDRLPGSGPSRQRTRGHRREVRHRGRGVRGHRHGPRSVRADRGHAGGAGDPADARVRPAAAAERRIAQPGPPDLVATCARSRPRPEPSR